MTYARDFSGIVFDNNGYSSLSDIQSDVLRIVDKYVIPSNPDWIYQEFKLPDDYTRGDPTDPTPPLTAIQINCGIDSSFAQTATFSWTLDIYDESGWDTLTSGKVIGVHADGDNVWADIYFSSPVEITDDMLDSLFRFGVRPPAKPNRPPVRNRLITSYRDDRPVFLTGDGPIFLDRMYENQIMETVNDLGEPVIIWRESGSNRFYWSDQYGLLWYWYATDPPYYWSRAKFADGSKLQNNARDTALNFRILAGVADTGQDILGNVQRQVAVEKSASNLDTFTDKKPEDFWLSKPNPSAFAVECLYFDMTDGSGQAQVVDRILLDPLTQDVYFHIYYSSEGAPGESEGDWEDKLWTPVTKTFKMRQREVHALPEPITAKYIKLEFSHLKPEEYDPGEISLPILYKKHPKWVLSYFVALLNSIQNSDDAFVARQVQVNYNALDLAYNYYLDDLGQQPSAPVHLAPNTNESFLSEFLTTTVDRSDQVDTATLERIKIAFEPFAREPNTLAPVDSVLRYYQIKNNNLPQSYPVEVQSFVSTTNFADVSSLRRDNLLFEATFPVMFFYVTSRHAYKLATASLSDNKAYFVGIREIAFTREHYTSTADTRLYVEGVGDNVNVARNEFLTDPETFDWVVNE